MIEIHIHKSTYHQRLKFPLSLPILSKIRLVKNILVWWCLGFFLWGELILEVSWLLLFWGFLRNPLLPGNSSQLPHSAGPHTEPHLRISWL